MHGVTAKVDVLFNSLQSKQILIRQQLALFDDFISRLRELVGVIGPLLDTQIGAFGLNDRPRFMSLVNAGIVFGVSVDNILTFVKGRGSFTMVEYAKLDAELAASLVDSFRDLFIKLASGVRNILPQRDISNVAIHDTPLLCLPLSFCNMREDEFVALAVRIQSHIESKFTAKDNNALKSEHQEFRRDIRGKVVLKSIKGFQTNVMSFDEGWGGGLNKRFTLLCKFAGGLTSTYTGTARVESDFSILGVENNAYQTYLMKFSLNVIMHTKELMELQALATCLS